MLIVPGTSIWKVAERKPGAGKHREDCQTEQKDEEQLPRLRLWLLAALS